MPAQGEEALEFVDGARHAVPENNGGIQLSGRVFEGRTRSELLWLLRLLLLRLLLRRLVQRSGSQSLLKLMLRKTGRRDLVGH